jgi:hypothetical protein
LHWAYMVFIVASMSSPFPIGDVIWTGTPKIYKQPLKDTDAFVQRWFCPDCGSTLATVSERNPDLMWLKMALFDSPPPLSVEVWRSQGYGQYGTYIFGARMLTFV